MLLLHRVRSVVGVLGLRFQYIIQFQAKSPEDGQVGLLFMQEMLELTKFQNQVGQLQVCFLWLLRRIKE